MSNTPNRNLSLPEFTPIGSKSTNIEPTHSITNLSPLKFHNQRSYKLNRQHGYPLHRTKDRDEIELIQSSSVASSVWDDGVIKEEKNVSNQQFSRLFGRNGIAGDDSIDNVKSAAFDTDIQVDTNMIKEQSEMVKKLQGENTNLRIEVLTLRRHMNGMPTDSVELIRQNVLLNQELVKLKEMLTMNPKDSDELYNIERELAKVNNNCTELLQEKDSLLRDMFDKDTDLQSLRDQCIKYESEVFELKMELDEQKQKQTRQTDDDHNKEIGRLENEKYCLQKELDELSKDYDDLEHENAQLKEQVAALQLQQEDREGNNDNEQIDQLRTDFHELQKEKARLVKEHDAELRSKYHSYREKIADMTQQLQEATSSIDHLDKDMVGKEREIDAASKEIKVLNGRVDMLEKKNALLEKRLKNGEPEQEATKLLTQEVDDLYKKIEDYERQIHELKEALRKMEDDAIYIEDLEEDKGKLIESIRKLEELVKDKDTEIVKLQMKEVNEDEDVDETREHSYIDGILQLQEKFEEEREAHNEQLEKLVNDTEKVKNNLLAQIDELEASKKQLVVDYEDLRYEYDLLISKMDEEQIDELSNDLAKVSIEYKKLIDERERLVDIYEAKVAFLNDEIARKDLEKMKKPGVNTNVGALYGKLDSLEKAVKELRDVKETLEQDKVRLGDERVKLLSENGELKKYVKKYDESRAELFRIEKERDELKNTIQEMKDGEVQMLMKSGEVKNKVQLFEMSKQGIINEYEIKLEMKDKQYNDIVKEYNFMKDDLINRVKQMKVTLERDHDNKHVYIDEWKQKYEKVLKQLHLSEHEVDELRREIQRQQPPVWFPPTPESPSRGSMVDSIPMEKFELLRNQKELLMIKYAEKCEKVCDLKFMLKYYKLENANQLDLIESNKVILNIPKKGKKIVDPLRKLRCYFLVALANVRMRKRLEEKMLRESKNRILKRQIDMIKHKVL